MLAIRSCHVLMYNNVLFAHAVYFRNEILFKLKSLFLNRSSKPHIPLLDENPHLPEVFIV